MCMKIVTLSGWLDDKLETGPGWSLEERGAPVRRREKETYGSIEGTLIPINERVLVVDDFIPDGYVYKHTDRWNGFEFCPDTAPDRHQGYVYVYLRTHNFFPNTNTGAHFKNPIYEEQPDQNQKTGVRQIWQLRSGECLTIRWRSRYWKVSNFNGRVLFEELFSDETRRVVAGDLKMAPIGTQAFYAEQELRRLECQWSKVRRWLERNVGLVSRYRRPGHGHFGDLLPP